MTAITMKIEVEQGSDWAHGWLVTYNGDPIDETWTARSQARYSPLSATVLHDFTAEVNEDGAVVIAVSASDSSEWDWDEGVYDVEVTNADESVTLRVAQGTVTVNREVTR